MVEGVLWTGLCFLALTTAGPLDRFPRDASEDYQSDLSAYANFTANEVCFSDNEVFQKGDLMPNPGPCEECRCEPPSIVCQMVKCPVNNNGCRTIQRPNHCCPDYNCECDYNGQLYNDGERLDLPDQPCQVCYCKGGEVMCTSLTCYTRNDCEPQHVAGQCCPKYTNCPLRDMAVTSTDDKNIQTRSSNKTAHSPKREMQPWLLTNSAVQTSSAPVTKRSGYVTNEDGLVIVVSDWLTERKTTPENSDQGQMLKDVTNSEESHTLNTEKPALVTKSEEYPTIRAKVMVSSPLDEVIFTRIDSLNSQDKHIASSTHIVSNLLDDFETTNTPTKTTPSDEFTYENTASKNNWSTKTPLYSTTTYSKMNIHEQVSELEENSTDEPHNNLDGKEVESYTKPGSARLDGEVATNLQTTEFKITKDIDREESLTKHDKNKSTQKPIKQVMDVIMTSKIDDKLGDKKQLNESAYEEKPNINIQKDLVHFDENDFNKTEDSKFVKPLSTSPSKALSSDAPKYGTTNDTSFTNNEHDTQLTNLLETTTDGYWTTNFPKDPHTTVNMSMNIEDHRPNSFSTEKYLSKHENHYDVTEIEFSDMTETTTLYFTEDHMLGIETEQDKLPVGYKSVEEYTIPNSQESSSIDNMYINKEREPGTELPEVSVTSNQKTSTDIRKVTELSKENVKSNVHSETFNDEIEELSSEEAKFKIEELNIDENLREGSNSSVADVVYQNITDTETAPITVVPMAESAQPYEQFEKDDEKIESTASGGIKYDQTDTKSGQNILPVLELNSHVPFLIIGGGESSDASDTFEDIPMLTTTDESEEADFTDHTGIVDNIHSTITKTNSSTSEGFIDKLAIKSSTTSNNSSSTTPESSTNADKEVQLLVHPTISSSHIPLTPGDLKVLAEHLIKEKIKPVEASKDPTYPPNEWLKGNLTSEEKIASIMAAANVSVGFMNRTLKGELISLNTKQNSSGKNDKELTLKGNSFTENANKKVSNEKNVFDKYGSRKFSPNYNTMLNDGFATMKAATDPTQDKLTFLPQVTTSKQIDNVALQNVSSNDSFGNPKQENEIELRNKTNDLVKESFGQISSSFKVTEDNVALGKNSTEGPNNAPNKEYISNDSIIFTSDGIQNEHSKNIKENNERKSMDDLTKNSTYTSHEASRNSDSEMNHKPSTTEVSQKATSVP